MKRKSLTIWVFTALSMLSGVMYAATDEKQKQRSVTAPKGRLQDIEKYISQSRKRTEDYYASRLKELKLRAQEEIKLFEKIELDALDGEAVSADLLLANRGCVPPNYIKNKNGLMLPNERVALAESRIAEKKKEIVESLERSGAAVERQKKYALSVSLAGLEKRLKENALIPKAKPTHGVVTGIVYGEGKQTALIDKEIVHPGDAIHGVKVVRIRRDSVEFEKKGKVWKQKVRETAESFWQ
jgi:hypothetical protein